MDTLLKWARSVGSIHAFLYHFYKLTIHKMYMPLRPRPHIQILLKMDTFFLRFYKICTMQKICVRHKNATTMEMWQHLLLNMLLAYDVWHRFSFVHM